MYITYLHTACVCVIKSWEYENWVCAWSVINHCPQKTSLLKLFFGQGIILMVPSKHMHIDDYRNKQKS